MNQTCILTKEMEQKIIETPHEFADICPIEDKDVNQKLVLKENAKLLLPVTTDPIDVRLVFEGIDNPNLTLPAVKWESEDEPNIVEGYVYDILFQYIDDKIGWLAGYIKYA